jgi:hypothetical protein
LNTLGLAPAIQDLRGIASFTDAELADVEKQMSESNTSMPTFGDLSKGASRTDVTEPLAPPTP